MTDRPEKPSDEALRAAIATLATAVRFWSDGDGDPAFAQERAALATIESELTARTAETEEQAAELAQAEAVFAELALPVLNERPRSDAASAWRDKVQAALNAIRVALAKARGGEGG